MLWDARPSGLSGGKIEKLLEMCEITVNKNSVVGDVSAVSPGGVRLGTPAVTTRGMGRADMQTIADFLHEAVQLGQRIHDSCGGGGGGGGSGETETGVSMSKNTSKSTKLKDFISAAEQHAEFQADIASIRKRVERFAASFPLPGVDPNLAHSLKYNQQ